MFKPKLPQQEQGFTLVEVLVAILITTLFVAVSMQAMVLAAVFKARAQESAEATTWIQEDLENVKYQASRYKDNTECAPAIINNGYADGFRDSLLKLNNPTNDPANKIGNQTGSYPEIFEETSRTKKKFRLRRITNPVDVAPYNRLEVSYDVSPIISTNTFGKSIANFYTEVIPNAAFQCP